MSLRNQVFAQAKLLAGELDERHTALLEVLCGAAAASLETRLRENVTVEDCAEEFVSAASLHALSDLQDADDAAVVEEFRAGDLTVKKGSRQTAASDSLRRQAENMMRPYLKDGFCFAGV